jgi:hypothetical protein
LSPIVPHLLGTLDGEDLMAHWGSVPESNHTSENLCFHRWHFKDTAEASRFVEALKQSGGYGQVIHNSVRAVEFWNAKILRLLPKFQTGSLKMSKGDYQYDDPLAHTQINTYPGFESDTEKRRNAGRPKNPAPRSRG